MKKKKPAVGDYGGWFGGDYGSDYVGGDYGGRYRLPQGHHPGQASWVG